MQQNLRWNKYRIKTQKKPGKIPSCISDNTNNSGFAKDNHQSANGWTTALLTRKSTLISYL